MPDEILTLPEVAQLLKVAEKTVYTMAQKSQLPAFKVRGQWRFKRVDIDRWIEAQKMLAGPPARHWWRRMTPCPNNQVDWPGSGPRCDG